ncbi:MAG: FG-GAP repeat protein [Planctomycetes bacterium]|nr:FG-GAP repeat protein [Planctomycetota bacterium]
MCASDKLRLLLGAGLVSVLCWGPTATGQWVEGRCEVLATAQGFESGALYGWLVTSADDADGDGVDDFAVAAPFGGGFRGRITVHSGADGSQIWSYTIPTASAILGFSLDRMNDVDGDGVDEIVAGGPWNPGVPGGRLLVFSGATGAIIHTFAGPVEFDTYGHSVATGGDFNGDGVPDLVFSGINVDNGAGRVFVHSGDDLTLIFTIDPPTPPAFFFGTGIAFIGDVNKDGRDDLAIGDRLAQDFGPQGRIHVFSYDGKQPVHEFTINDIDQGIPLESERIDGGRDYDQDGTPDIYLGERRLNRVRVFSGADGSVIHTIQHEEIASFGPGRMIGDIDGDGVPDLLIGAQNDSTGGDLAGRVFFYSGADGSLLRTMTPTVAGMRFGADAAPVGDLNGDGTIDFVVSAMGAAGGLGQVLVMAGIPDSQIPGDLDGDGMVGILDLLILLSSWGPCPDPPESCPADLDSDGAVGIFDLLTLLANWG